MDRERDVLFLALSSHGKRDAKLVVTNGALPLNWLTGQAIWRECCVNPASGGR